MMDNDNKLQENLMEHILEVGECWVIDLFPRQIQNFKKYKMLELYLLKTKNRKLYAQKIIECLWKIIPYYDLYIWFVERTKKIYLHDVPFVKLEKIIKKKITKDETINILIEAYNIVIQIQLYNTSIHFEQYEDILLIKEIVEHEGFYVWKSPI